MPIRIGGETNPAEIYVGTESIGEVYVGTELVWQKSGALPSYNGVASYSGAALSANGGTLNSNDFSVTNGSTAALVQDIDIITNGSGTSYNSNPATAQVVQLNTGSFVMTGGGGIATGPTLSGCSAYLPVPSDVFAGTGSFTQTATGCTRTTTFEDETGYTEYTVTQVSAGVNSQARDVNVEVNYFIPTGFLNETQTSGTFINVSQPGQTAQAGTVNVPGLGQRGVGGPYQGTPSSQTKADLIETGITDTQSATPIGTYSLQVFENASSITTSGSVTYTVGNESTNYDGGTVPASRTFSWNVTNGSITSGQGTSQIVVTPTITTGSITATCTGSFAGAASTTFTASDSESTSVVHDTFSGSFNFTGVPANAGFSPSSTTWSRQGPGTVSWMGTLTAGTDYQFSGGQSSITVSGTATASSNGQTITVNISGGSGYQTPTAKSYTTTMNWSVASFTNSDQLTLNYTSDSESGVVGTAYSFTDPGSSVHTDYQLSGSVTFSGDSLTGNIPSGGSTLSRTASATITQKVYSWNYGINTPTGLTISNHSSSGAASSFGISGGTVSGNAGDPWSATFTYAAASGYQNPSVSSASVSGTGSVSTNGLTVTYSGTIPSGGGANTSITMVGSADFEPTCSNVDGSGTAAAITGFSTSPQNCFGSLPGCDTTWTSNTGLVWVDPNPTATRFVSTHASGTTLCYFGNSTIRVGPALPGAAGTLANAGTTAEASNADFCSGNSYNIGPQSC